MNDNRVMCPNCKCELQVITGIENGKMVIKIFKDVSEAQDWLIAQQNKK